jgi:DNA mismatch repair ATPase MutS
VGDFYEVFDKNAVAISNELDLTLTSREMGLEKRLPMIGFPYHCAERYFEEIAKKHRLVIVEDHKATEYVDEVDAFEADLDTLQEMEQNNVSVAQLEEDVDCNENGVVKDDDYKALQTLSELLGVNVILR